MAFNMNKKTILLADDDLDDTEMFCEALIDVNEKVICHCAANGNEVLDILNKLDENPDLIFMDVNMPIMNGWECLKVLKKDKKYQNIPVIMISTSSHKKDVDTASDLGCIGYFVKPNNFNDLKYILNSITSNLGPGLKDTIASLQENQSGNIFACSEG